RRRIVEVHLSERPCMPPQDEDRPGSADPSRHVASAHPATPQPRRRSAPYTGRGAHRRLGAAAPPPHEPARAAVARPPAPLVRVDASPLPALGTRGSGRTPRDFVDRTPPAAPPRIQGGNRAHAR